MPRPTTTRSRIPLGALALVLLLGAVPAGPARAFTVAGAVDTVAVDPGGTFTVDLVVRDPDLAFNAFDLSVHFDPAWLTLAPMSPVSQQRGALMVNACTLNAPFHVFTPGPDSAVCTLVILCDGVSVTGPGTIYRLRFVAAQAPAWTQLEFGPGTSFFAGGPRVAGVATRGVTVKIGSPVLDVGGPPGVAAAPELDPVTPNPSPPVRSLAVSFSLPRAGSCDVAVLDPQGRRVAGAPWTRREAGPQRVQLELPRLAPGRYTVALRTAGAARTRPWVVLR